MIRTTSGFSPSRVARALIAASIASSDEARRLADAAADNDIARMRLAAQGETRRQAQIAIAEPEIATAEPASESGVRPTFLRTPGRAAPARGGARDLAVAGPLQLAQVAAPQTAQPAQRETDGPVRSRLRELASDVQRIPSFLQSAAHWVADAVPKPKLPLLPSQTVRPFTAAI